MARPLRSPRRSRSRASARTPSITSRRTAPARPVGDPIEIAALTQAFRSTTQKKGFCAIGSVKTNIGHLDAAAGVAGLIKTVLALRHAQLPPSLHFEKPHPISDLPSTPFYVNAKLANWPRRATPRRAGVSSLGIGGTNAHIVLEEAPRVEPASPPSRAFQLLTISARTDAALDRASADLMKHLRENEALDLADAAFTLHVGRKAFARRRTLVVTDRADAITALEKLDPQRVSTHSTPPGTPSLVFMLPGGGAQHPRMAFDLYASEPVYREEVDRCLARLEPRLAAQVRNCLFPDADHFEEAAQEFERPSIQLPALFTTEYALAKLWMSFGLKPAAMIGHSLGENTAACLAGVLSLEDALGLVALRGRLFETVQEGGMLGVSLPPDELKPLLGDELALAVVNAPALCVASGPKSAIDALERTLVAREIDCTRIRISIAAHSSLVEPILPQFGAYLRGIALNAPKIPFVSNLTGTWITDAQATDPQYWVDHLRNTVRFSDGVKKLLEADDRFLLEVGPGNTLSSLARLHGNAALGKRVCASLRHRDEAISDVAFLLGVLGKLWGAGAKIDWKAFHAGERRLRVPLPTYPFEHQRYWIEPGVPVHTASASSNVLKKKSDVADWFYTPAWKKKERPAAPASERMRWLVFLNEVEFGSSLATELEASGAEVITVQIGESFKRLDDTAYAIAPEERADYFALIEDLEQRALLPDRIAHTWLVTESEATPVTTTFFHRMEERGFYSLLFLAQALGNATLDKSVHIGVVSNGMQRVANETLRHPAKATVLGPCRVIPQELPDIGCTSVDVVLPDARSAKARAKSTADLARAIASELTTPSNDALVALRGDERFVQTYEPVRLDPPAAVPARLREGGVYLITGGLGGIGLVLAECLAKRVHAKLVLVARGALPERERWSAWLDEHSEQHPTSKKIRKLLKLEALGGEVMFAAADVANIEQMTQVFAQARARFGALNGVIHAAGVIDDGVIQEKTPASVDKVFTPKVHGTLLLESLLKDVELDLFVSFSSTSSILGPAGQVDYTAANAFLNAVAQRRATTSKKTYNVAINWGIWREVGMAAETAARQERTEIPSSSARTKAAHPLLGHCVSSSADELVYSAEYSPKTHWLLDQHRLKSGAALIPGTGYLEIARAALDGRGCEGSVELRDVSFFSPLVVDDRETREVRIRLRREDELYAFSIESKSRAATDAGAWQLHAQGKLGNVDMPAASRQSIAEIEARCKSEDPARSGITTSQAKHLAFGPRWDVLKRASYGVKEALALLELPERYRGDLDEYRLHPALLDLATGYGLPLIDDYAAGDDFYAPLSYRRVRVHGPLPAQVYSHIRLRENANAKSELAQFDVAITDLAGNVLVEVEQFSVRKMSSVAALTNKSSSGPAARDAEGADSQQTLATAGNEHSPLFQLLHEGILPDEGVDAFLRILSHGDAPQIVVSSLDLAALIERFGPNAAVKTDAPKSQFARPNLAASYVAPRDEIESTLVEFWQELLGVDQVGVQDNFFELGGYSLIAVRLFAKVKKAYKLEFPLSILFEAPTIELCAQRIREQLGEDVASKPADSNRRVAQKSFLVPMHAGKAWTAAAVLPRRRHVRQRDEPASSRRSRRRRSTDLRHPSARTRRQGRAARVVRGNGARLHRRDQERATERSVLHRRLLRRRNHRL